MSVGLLRDIRRLLRPRTLPLRALGRGRAARGANRRMAFLATIGALFWAGLFALSFRVLRYFIGIEDIGDLLAYKLLGMVLLVSFALMLFSGVLTLLSRLYLSRDLDLVHAMPVASYRIFLARWLDGTVESSWMVVVFTAPVFLAYGVVFGSGPAYYALTPLAVGLLAVVASALSAAAVGTAVMVVPASRMRSVVLLVGVLLFVALYLAVRLSRPEQLVNPEVFDSVLLYLGELQAPAAPYLPSTWASDAVQAALKGEVGTSLFHLALLGSAAAALASALALLADAYYFRGFSRTQTASTRVIRGRRLSERLFRSLPGPVRALAVKEVTTFLRDQTQWTQLFLIAALLVIYIYNFKALPLERSPIQTVYLQNLFGFLNMGLALFVLTAVTARFAYPAVSLEREAFWLVKASPVSLRSFLLIKFFIYYLPLLALTEVLVVGTNLLLGVTPFMMALSSATVFCLVPGVVAIGLGLGAAYPDFKAENPTQTVTSFGGLVFMIACAGLITAVILLEAGPVYRIFMADLHGRPLPAYVRVWTAAAFALAFALSVAAVVLPLRFGLRRLARMST
jgi:ABC-2 type transport system permease protein